MSASVPALAREYYPKLHAITESPGRPGRLVVTSNYGLFVTNTGSSWAYLCDTPLRTSGIVPNTYPDVVAFGESVLWGSAAPESGVFRSMDLGCNWSQVLDGSPYAKDRLVASAGSATIYAVVVAGNFDATLLFRSVDGGVRWSRGGEIPGVASGLAVAPADPARLYATSSLGDDRIVLAISMDEGATWAIGPDAPVTGRLAVDPSNADVVYLMHEHLHGGGSLYVSRSAGQTWTRVFVSSTTSGFALSAEGDAVLVAVDAYSGIGLLKTPGLYFASTSTFDFELIYPGAIGCVAWTTSGVYACTSRCQHGFDLGWAPAATFHIRDTNWENDRIPEGGASALRPLLTLEEVLGPVECDASDQAAACTSEWSNYPLARRPCDPVLDAGVEREGDPAPDDAGVPDAPYAGDARAEAPRKGETRSGCACRAGARRTGTNSGPGTLLGILALVGLRARKARAALDGGIGGWG